jgi:hypothetical protein
MNGSSPTTGAAPAVDDPGPLANLWMGSEGAPPPKRWTAPADAAGARSGHKEDPGGP